MELGGLVPAVSGREEGAEGDAGTRVGPGGTPWGGRRSCRAGAGHPPSIAQAPYSLRSLGGAPERQARRPAEAQVRLHGQVVRWPGVE